MENFGLLNFPGVTGTFHGISVKNLISISGQDCPPGYSWVTYRSSGLLPSAAHPDGCFEDTVIADITPLRLLRQLADLNVQMYSLEVQGRNLAQRILLDQRPISETVYYTQEAAEAKKAGHANLKAVPFVAGSTFSMAVREIVGHVTPGFLVRPKTAARVEAPKPASPV